VACVTLGFVGTSSANPLDSPGTIYIDGSPCNLACQSYMDWSRKALKANQAAAMGARTASAGKAAGETPRKRVSKRKAPAPVDTSPQNKTGDVQAALTATPEPPLPKPKPEMTSPGVETRNPQATITAAPAPPPVPKPATETAPLKVEAPEVSRPKTPQEQVMAALAVAELITNAETPKAAGNDGADETKSATAGDTAVHSRDVGGLVALLISRPDVKSASALKGLNVAVDAARSGDTEDIRLALAAAGATETQLSVSDASPLDRLISGDVQAAVLKLVSPDAAEAFPDIKGFKVLRVPLSPR
jgi:outer membrane biosynthesis protein TonB